MIVLRAAVIIGCTTLGVIAGGIVGGFGWLWFGTITAVLMTRDGLLTLHEILTSLVIGFWIGVALYTIAAALILPFWVAMLIPSLLVGSVIQQAYHTAFTSVVIGILLGGGYGAWSWSLGYVIPLIAGWLA